MMRERPYYHPQDVSGPTKAESELNLTGAERFLYDVYTRRAKRPDLDAFTHIPVAESKRDRAKEKELMERYKQTGDVRNDAMEAFLASEIETADWFEASVFRTTRYDDFLNGVDLVLEWDQGEENEPLRLAVDVTTATSPEALDGKLAKLKYGSTVKYFESDVALGEDGAPEQMSLSGLPTVILGFEREYLSTLAKEAVDHRTTRKSTDEYGRPVSLPDVRRDAFGDHPMGLVLLEQAKAQLGLQVQTRMNEVVRLMQGVPALDDSTKEALRDYAAAQGDTDAALTTMHRLFPAIKALLASKRLSEKQFNGWIERVQLYHRVREHLAAREKQNDRGSRTARVLSRGSGLHRRLTTFAA